MNQRINAMARCPTNGLRCSRYARDPPTGFVEHPGPLRHAEKGNNLTVSANYLIFDRAPRLRPSSNRSPGGTTKTRLPAMTALLMLGRDVRGACDAGQACPVLCSRQYERVPR